MFTLFFAVFFLAISGACIWRYYYLNKRDVHNHWNEGGITCAVIGVIILLLSFIASFASYSDQISDYEDLKKYDQLEKIYTEKANALTTQFAKYLADTYPAHERNIFKEISPEKVSIYLAKYPELQAVKTITLLVEQISGLQNDRYQQQVNKAIVLKNMRFRQKNPWIYNSWIPKFVQ